MNNLVVFYRHLHAMPRKSDHYLHKSSLHSSSLFVDGMGIGEKMPARIVDRPNGTDSCLLMFFRSPVGIRDDSGLRAHPANRLMLWPSGHAQYYGNKDSPWLHSWLHFSGGGALSFLGKIPIPKNRALPFSVSAGARFEKDLEEIHREMEDPFSTSETIISNLVENLLVRTFRALAGNTENRATPPHLLAVKRHIDENFTRPMTLRDLGRVASLSVPYLCNEFRSAFGLAPIEYRIRAQLGLAGFLLRDNNLRISEVAARAGYQDVCHFSRHFKKHYGTSPGLYRAQVTRARADR